MVMIPVAILLSMSGGTFWWGRHELGQARRERQVRHARTTLYYAIILLGLSAGFAAMAVARAFPPVPFAAALLLLIPAAGAAMAVRFNSGFANWLLGRIR